MSRWRLYFLIAFPFMAFSQEGFQGSFSATGLFNHKEQNPFWIYANTFGRLGSDATVMGLLETSDLKRFDSHNSLQVNAGFLARNGRGNDFYFDALHARYIHKNLQIDVGAWHREHALQELSGVGGDILWSGNARAVPGLEIQFLKGAHIFDWLTFNGKLGHYLLGKDRYVKNAQVHYKKLQLQVTLSERDKLDIHLSHYAQFGGNSPRYGHQPSGFGDYLKIFVGSNGGANATDSDQANALGNHLGSYNITYSMQRDGFDLKIYHQTIFEDTSGRELRNFPDGVWGIFFQPKEATFFDGILYEFIQTVSQSGKFVPPPNGNFRGGDNYFSNSLYQSGWTYKNRIIGLPFIIPEDDGTGIKINRSFVHHFAITGTLKPIHYTVKTSFVRNLGTYTRPLQPRENAVYSYLSLAYPTTLGTFKAQFAADYSDQNNELFGVGVGYAIDF